MFATVTPILTLLLAAAAFVRADPDPSSPGPGDVFVQGGACPISWDVDPTGRWKTMQIELMTGDNYDMISLATVGIVDGTNPSKNTYSYACPQVTPHAAIYFYQFTSPSTSNKAWTGRFTITDSPKNVVEPAEATQRDGTKIPWGTGSLVNGSSLASLTATVNASSATSTSTTHSTLSPSNTSTHSAVTSSSATATPSTVNASGENGATAAFFGNCLLFQIGLGLVLAVFGFAMMF